MSTEEKQLPKLLNLGCGSTLIPGAINVDFNHDDSRGILGFDLESCGGPITSGIDSHHPRYTGRLPFSDGYFDSVQASHVLEHIRNILPLMEEIHRVTKPGGHFWIRVPYGSNSIAFEDPTHVRQFFPKSFKYFGQLAYNKADYNYRGDWEVADMVVGIDNAYKGCPPAELEQLLLNAWNIGQEIFCTLECIKPIRVADGGPNQLMIKTAFMDEIHAQLAAIYGGDENIKH